MRIFQTFILPDNTVSKFKLSFAAVNFSRNLISGGGFDKVYSLIPVNVKASEIYAIQDDDCEIIYSKWRLKGGYRSKLAIFAEQWQLFKKINKFDNLWLYNLNFINAYLFILLRLFKSTVKVNIIVLDFTPPISWKEPNYWFLKMINRADGLICLSLSDLFKVKNMIVLPGVVPISQNRYPIIQNFNNEFLLSGVISDTISMTELVLEAFARLPNCILHITGKVVEGEELIIKYSKSYSNIKYHGIIPYSKYLELLSRITYQLSTRNPSKSENQCNFPSKIIEALLYNRIVISTISYPQLLGVNYFFVETGLNGFVNAIQRIISMDKIALSNYANQGERITQMYNADVWSESMQSIENNG